MDGCQSPSVSLGGRGRGWGGRGQLGHRLANERPGGGYTQGQANIVTPSFCHIPSTPLSPSLCSGVSPSILLSLTSVGKQTCSSNVKQVCNENCLCVEVQGAKGSFPEQDLD